MQFSWDTMTFINLILCIVILIFGMMGYQRSKSRVVLYVGVAFGLFGLSHLATLFGLKESLGTILIIIRTAAYLLVTYALFLAAFQNKK
ncbi:MAG: hypothetical protein MUO77_06220 [Anaerolineales bacterium]|nr:hypothetical protein [Anaerolineales bacterium]